MKSILCIALISIVLSGCEAFAPTTACNKKAVCSTTRTQHQSFFGFGLEEKQALSSSGGNALIEKAKNILENKSGFYSPYDEDVFADDFVFRGPFVGPLNKKDYLATMDAFGIYKAFPDISSNAWGFNIDPENPNRVWFMVRNTGTFTGEPLAPDSLNFKPNGAELQGCPETFSIIFDEEEKMKYLSVGYVADRFDGNTQGKGAAFGIFNVIGLPVPKVGPALRFLQWFSSEIYGKPPLSYSTDVPEWWSNKSQDKSAQGYL